MLEDIDATNSTLQRITAGPVGFDTEFTDPVATIENEGDVENTWRFKKLCVVQIAVHGTVYIIAVKAMKSQC
jgi:hypothetical protein